MLRFVPALIWIAFTYWGCLLPSSEIPTFDFWDKIYFDKILHFLLYAALLLWLLWGAKGISRTPEDTPELHYILTIIFCLLMGVSIEFLQDIMPLNRHFDIYDFFANAAGLLFGLFLWKRVVPRTIWAVI